MTAASSPAAMIGERGILPSVAVNVEVTSSSLAENTTKIGGPARLSRARLTLKEASFP